MVQRHDARGRLQQNPVVIDNLIDLTAYEDGGMRNLRKKVTSMDTSLRAAERDTSTEEDTDESVDYAKIDQLLEINKANAVGKSRSVEIGSRGSDPDLRLVTLDAAIAGARSTMNQSGQHSHSSPQRFPAALSLKIRQELDFVKDAIVMSNDPRRKGLGDAVSDRRRSYASPKSNERPLLEPRTPEPIPTTPSLESWVRSSRSPRITPESPRSPKSTDSSRSRLIVNKVPSGDSDGFLSNAAVRNVRTPEPIPTTPSLETEYQARRRSSVKTPEPIAVTESLEEYYRRRGPVSPASPYSTSPTPEHAEARVLNFEAVKMDTSRQLHSIGSNDTESAYTASSNAMYRRALAARKRKTAVKNSATGAFRSISRDGEEFEGESYRKALKEKYRRLVISPVKSSMDLDDGTYRTEDSRILQGSVASDIAMVETREDEEQRVKQQGELRDKADNRSHQAALLKSAKELARVKESLKQSIKEHESPKPRSPRVPQQVMTEQNRTPDQRANVFLKDSSIEVPDLSHTNSEPIIKPSRKDAMDLREVPDIPMVPLEPKRSRSMSRDLAMDASEAVLAPAKITVQAVPIQLVSPDRDPAVAAEEKETVVNSESEYLDMRKKKGIHMDMKDFDSVVKSGSAADKMEESVMQLISNDDEQGNEIALISSRYSVDLAMSDADSNTDNSLVETQTTDMVEIKKAIPAEDPSEKKATDSVSTKKKVGFSSDVKDKVATKKVDESDEGISEDDSRFNDSHSKYSGNTSGAESDSKLSIINSDTSDSDLGMDPELDAHVLYDSEALHFVVQLLDKSCAWLDEDGCACNKQDPSLLKEIKKKSLRRYLDPDAAPLKTRLSGKAQSLVTKKPKNPLLQKLQAKRVTEPSDTEDSDAPVSVYARPRRKRGSSPKKQTEEDQVIELPPHSGGSRSGSPRRRRSRSPRKTASKSPSAESKSSPKQGTEEDGEPASPFQKKLQERLKSVRSSQDGTESVVSELERNVFLDNPSTEGEIRSTGSHRSHRSASPIKETRSNGSQLSSRSKSPKKEKRSSAPRPPSPRKESRQHSPSSVQSSTSHVSNRSRSPTKGSIDLRSSGSYLSRGSGSALDPVEIHDESPRRSSPVRSRPLEIRTRGGSIDAPEVRTESSHTWSSDEVGSPARAREPKTPEGRHAGSPLASSSPRTPSPRTPDSASRLPPEKLPRSHQPMTPDSASGKLPEDGDAVDDSLALQHVHFGRSDDDSISSQLRNVIRTYGGPEHSAPRTRRVISAKAPPRTEVRFGTRLETIQELNSPASRKDEEDDPFAGLTEEERQAALELAEKLRRRAATLKRRRRAREQRMGDSGHSMSTGDYSSGYGTGRALETESHYSMRRVVS